MIRGTTAIMTMTTMSSSRLLLQAEAIVLPEWVIPGRVRNIRLLARLEFPGRRLPPNCRLRVLPQPRRDHQGVPRRDRHRQFHQRPELRRAGVAAAGVDRFPVLSLIRRAVCLSFLPMGRLRTALRRYSHEEAALRFI